jgi:hypothetical protein
MTISNRNAEFDVHVFKRRATGQQGDRYTIGVWVGTCARAICHDATLDVAIAALRQELETAGALVVVPNGTH